MMVNIAAPQAHAQSVLVAPAVGGALADMKLSSDGKTAFVTNRDQVRIYDLTTHKLAHNIVVGRGARALAVATNASAKEGQFAVRTTYYGAVSEVDEIKIWSYPASKQVSSFGATGVEVNDLGFARDGQMFAVMDDNGVRCSMQMGSCSPNPQMNSKIIRRLEPPRSRFLPMARV